MSETLVVNSEMHAIDTVDQWVEHLARQWNIPNATRFAIKLCCEESFVNIVLHGVGRRHGHASTIDSSVRLQMERLDHDIQLMIEDHGEAFDPSKVEPPRHATGMNAGVGGNGIHLMRRFSKQMSYQRLGNCNHLTLKFSLPETTPTSLYPAYRLHETSSAHVANGKSRNA